MNEFEHYMVCSPPCRPIRLVVQDLRCMYTPELRNAFIGTFTHIRQGFSHGTDVPKHRQGNPRRGHQSRDGPSGESEMVTEGVVGASAPVSVWPRVPRASDEFPSEAPTSSTVTGGWKDGGKGGMVRPEFMDNPSSRTFINNAPSLGELLGGGRSSFVTVFVMSLYVVL